MNEVLAEIPRVREDLGFPPLVTPTSQIVGTQAVLNVLTGERYKTITNEVKLYLQGRYGKAPGKINEAVQRAAIGDEDMIDLPACGLAGDRDAQAAGADRGPGEVRGGRAVLRHVSRHRPQFPRRTRQKCPGIGTPGTDFQPAGQ